MYIVLSYVAVSADLDVVGITNCTVKARAPELLLTSSLFLLLCYFYSRYSFVTDITLLSSPSL